MWAFVRLSFVSLGVCDPVTSILTIVALNDKDGAMGSVLMVKVAVPNENGREPPVDVVKRGVGVSCSLVMSTVYMMVAPCPPVPATRRTSEARRIGRSRSMD